MPTPYALTSELEAINICLHAVGEAPVDSTAEVGLIEVRKAKAKIAEASKLIQEQGWWFNTEYDVSLLPDVTTSYILLPQNTLRFAPDRYYHPRVVARGEQLYDEEKRVYTFTAAVKGTLISLLEWKLLPEAARYYIAVLAARLMQGNPADGSDKADRTTQEMELRAQANLRAADYEASKHNLTASYDVASIVMR